MPKNKSDADTLNIDRYKSPPTEFPKTEATKQRWLDIYYEYAKGIYTTKDVADKYKLHINSVTPIIKWAVHFLKKEIDPDAYKQIMEDRIVVSLKELHQDKKKCTNMKDKMYVTREIRLHNRLMGEILSILRNKEERGDGKVQVNVQINQLDRGTGVEVNAKKKKDND